MQKRNNGRRDVYGNVRVVRMHAMGNVMRVLVECLITGRREYRVMAV